MKRILLFVLLLTNYTAFAQFSSCKNIGLRIGYTDIKETLRIASEGLNSTNSRLSPNEIQSDDEYPFYFCPGASVALQGEVGFSTSVMTRATYEWHGPNGEKSNESIFELKKINQNTAGNYILKMTISRQSCPDTTITKVRKIEVTVPQLEVLAGNVCEGGDIKLEAKNNYAYVSDPYYEKSKKVFNWSGPNGFASTESNPTVKNVKGSGIYTVSITFSDLCIGTSQTTVKITTLKESSIITNYTPSCIGGQAILKASPTVTGATGTYLWKGPNGFSQEGQEITIKNISEKDAGAYKVIVRFEGICTNTDSSFAFLGIESPLPTFDKLMEFCDGMPVQFPKKRYYPSMYYDNPGQIVTYNWTGPKGFQSNEESPTIDEFYKDQAGYYKLQINIEGKCHAQVNKSFYLNPVEKPFLNIYNSFLENSIKKGESISLKAESSQFSSANHFTWVGPDNLSLGSYLLDLDNFDEKKAGIYTVTLKADGCKEKSSASIELKLKTNSPKLVTRAWTSQRTTSYCKGTSFQLNAYTEPSDDKTIYQWIGPNGFKAEGKVIDIKNIDDAKAGVYTVVAFNQFGSEMDTIRVFSIKTPEVYLQDTLKICEGGEQRIFPNLTPTAYSETITNYEWTGPNNFKSAGSYVNFRNFTKSQEGEYKLKINFTGGCEGEINKNFKVIATQPSVNWAIDKLCNGKLLFTPTFNTFSQNTFVNYKIFNDNKQEVQSPIDTSASTIYTIETLFSGACVARNQVQVDTKDARPFKISLPEITEACVGSSINLSATSKLDFDLSSINYFGLKNTASLMYLNWFGPNNLLKTSTSFSIIDVKKEDAGKYKVVATLTGECTGTYEAETELRVQVEKPQFYFNFTQEKMAVNFEIKTQDTLSDLYWDFGNGQFSKDRNPGPIFYANSGIYTINIQATNACGTSSLSERIDILKEETILGNENLPELLTFTVSPNPSAGIVEITNPNKLDVQLVIYTMDGKMVDTFGMDKNQNTVKYDFNDYLSGVYLIKCIQKNGQVRTRKIVIHK